MEEIFVFGSNLAGRHGKGAALHAKNHYGAEYGVGEGLTGRAYALPTKDVKLRTLPFEKIEQNIAIFVEFARQRPEKRFLLTPVGTGLAGYPRRDVFTVLQELEIPDNIVLTASWTYA